MRGVHWFRNDLRLRDNGAIAALADRVTHWTPVFVLDPTLLDPALRRPRDRFLIDCLARLREELEGRGVPLFTVRGQPSVILPRLMRRLGADVLSLAEADSPYARRRDARVRTAIESDGREWLGVRDHTVFGPGEIRTKAGGTHSIYSPYRRAWWTAWNASPRLPARGVRLPARPIPVARRAKEDVLPRLVLHAVDVRLPTGGEAAARRRLRDFLSRRVRDYAHDRDLPAVDGTARLSAHLRFGAISARQCFAAGLAHAREHEADRQGVEKWLDELVWREFYAGILAGRADVVERDFRPTFGSLAWRDDDEAFAAWATGRTGYPVVDAGIRQLLATGWMHNRVRMVVASFLTKDLLIDWRRGARFFMDHLVDGDPASNSGGWQWAASTGTDAQPWFRIFNPTKQGERWDPEGRYVRRWVPELRGVAPSHVHAPWSAPRPPRAYPAPIVDHAAARERALDAFRRAR